MYGTGHEHSVLTQDDYGALKDSEYLHIYVYVYVHARRCEDMQSVYGTAILIIIEGQSHVVCVYIYVYIYIYIYTHTHTHTMTYVSTHTQLSICV